MIIRKIVNNIKRILKKSLVYHYLRKNCKSLRKNARNLKRICENNFFGRRLRNSKAFERGNCQKKRWKKHSRWSSKVTVFMMGATWGLVVTWQVKASCKWRRLMRGTTSKLLTLSCVRASVTLSNSWPPCHHVTQGCGWPISVNININMKSQS